MLRVRWFVAAATALLSVAAGFAALLFSAAQSPALAAGDCAAAADLLVLPSPAAPWTGAPLRVMIVAEKPVEGALSLIAPDGSVAAKSPDRQTGPPYFWFAEVAEPAAGKWQATLAAIIDRMQPGHAGDRRRARASPLAFRRTRGKNLAGARSWNSTTEALFSAWIEKLFDAPPDQDLSWKVWSEVLRDQSRNFLFNYLGRGEDNVADRPRPTAPTSSISCAPISPSRWGCRSAIRIARAASAASHPNVTSGSTSSIPR